MARMFCFELQLLHLMLKSLIKFVKKKLKIDAGASRSNSKLYENMSNSSWFGQEIYAFKSADLLSYRSFNV